MQPPLCILAFVKKMSRSQWKCLGVLQEGIKTSITYWSSFNSSFASYACNNTCDQPFINIVMFFLYYQKSQFIQQSMYIIIVKRLSVRLLMLQLSFSVDGSDSQITCSSSEIQTFITHRIRRHTRIVAANSGASRKQMPLSNSSCGQCMWCMNVCTNNSHWRSPRYLQGCLCSQTIHE